VSGYFRAIPMPSTSNTSQQFQRSDLSLEVIAEHPRAVRDVVRGKPVKNKEALANPEALALYAGSRSCNRDFL
jgi:hypothetical protein